MAKDVLPLSQWSKEIGSLSPIEWDRLPEIYLYMDQVLNYMDNQLKLFEPNPEDPLLTSSMVNNYVKAGILPRPEQKKYSREHLVLLTLICHLKSVLSIPDISTLLRSQLQEVSEKDLYASFSDVHTLALKEVSDQVQSIDETEEAALTHLALKLSVEASARRTAAEKILFELELRKKKREEELQKELEKEKEKHKDN